MFAWQVLLGRIPTWVNLRRRGVLVVNDIGGCVWCSTTVESEDHFFVRCKFASGVWYGILKWVGVITVLSGVVSMQLEAFLGQFQNKEFERLLLV